MPRQRYGFLSFPERQHGHRNVKQEGDLRVSIRFERFIGLIIHDCSHITSDRPDTHNDANGGQVSPTAGTPAGYYGSAHLIYRLYPVVDTHSTMNSNHISP